MLYSVGFATAFAAPAAPSGLNAVSLTATSFTLRWTASTGGTGGISGYDIFRDSVLIGSTSAARTFVVTGLSPTTTYNMTVTARDGIGGISASSIALAVITPDDATVPSKPANLLATSITTTSCTLTWMGSTDNVGVIGYNIYRNGVLLGSVSAVTLTFGVTGLSPDTNNNLTVRAADAAGNVSGASVALAVRTLALPPSVPLSLITANLKPASFTLKWIASTGGIGGIAGYEVYLNDTLVGSPTARSLTLTGLKPSTAYTMTVVSRDAVDNLSALSTPLIVTTQADTTKPTVPKGLNASAVSYNSFTLVWTASSDNVGVTGYDVYRNNVLIGSTSSSFFNVTGLAPSTFSSMRVKARDAAGNISGYSAILSVTTSAPPNIAPTIKLNSPADGSSFTLPSTLTLSATATDGDGTISKVEFFDNSTLLGEAITPASPNTFTMPLTFTSSGIHSLSARATDNRNATTDSASIAITVNNPNRFPAISITAPATGTNLTAPGFITLCADATDSDGTIAKVEFYDGGTWLGEALTSSILPSTFTFPLTLFSTGTHAITAVATDNSTAQSTSASVVINVNSGAALLPFVANFEPTEGFNFGPLTGQLSWVATGGVTVAPSVTPAGQQELSISAGQPTEIFSRDFSATGISPVFVDFQAHPVAGVDPSSAVMFSTPAAQVALVGLASPSQLWIFGGGGQGWYASGQSIATDVNGRTLDWLRLTTREDYITKKWDLYLNGLMVAADVPFADANATSLTDFSMNGHAIVASAFDSFYAGLENPLFVDADHDGLDDAWETAHGLDPTLNDRNGDLDDDGVSNIQECCLGTNPNNPGSNGDSDNNGLPDAWEQQWFGHIGNDPLADPDGDNQTNMKELQGGTDPTDYYNGETRQVLSLQDSSEHISSDGALSVIVLDKNSVPLVNAPVKFAATEGGHLISVEEGGVGSASVVVRTNTQGVARAYVVGGMAE